MNDRDDKNARPRATLKNKEGKRDSDALFERLGALLSLGKDQDALSLIAQEAAGLEKQLDRLIPIHLDVLLSTQRYDEAYEAIRHYAELPYYNQETEEMIKTYPAKIRLREKASFAPKGVTPGGIKKELRSPDPLQVLLGLQAAARAGYRPYEADIRRILASDINDNVRTFALLVLVEAHVQEEISFSKNGIDYAVVPDDLDPPFIGPVYGAFIDALHASGESPEVVHTAEELFRQYLMAVYPEEVLGDDNDLLYLALLRIARKYLALPLEDRPRDPSTDIPRAKVEAAADEIEEMLAKSAELAL